MLKNADFLQKQKSKNSCKNAWYSENIRRFGGGRWIRTTEVIDSRFTVCPLWPLGNSPIWNCLLVGGAGRRIRTPDLLITNQLLYQLSYTSEFSFRSCIHSLISSAYIIYHILHHLSTLFSNFLKFFWSIFIFWRCPRMSQLDYYIILNPIRQGVLQKNFSLYFSTKYPMNFLSLRC